MAVRSHFFGALCAVLVCSVQALSLPESDKATPVPLAAPAAPSVAAPSSAPSVVVEPPAPTTTLTAQASDAHPVAASPEAATAPVENSASETHEQSEDDPEVEKSTVLSMSLQEATDFLKRDPVAASPVKGFAVIGDWGCVNDRQRAVAEQMHKYMEAYNSTFVVALGDNFYENGVKSADDPQFQNTFENVYNFPMLQRRWYVILGNHDHRQSVTAQMDYTKKSNRWFLPARYYSRSFAVPGAKTLDMIFIDTVSLLRGDPDQLNWLQASLAASKASYLFVSGHHPVYSKGEHGSTHRLIRKLKPLFETYKVSAYLSGHDHSLQLHVDNGVNYVVSGAGCKQGWFPGPNQTPFVRFHRARNGFTLFSFAADGTSLNTMFIDLRGNAMYQFAIQPRA